MTTAETWEEIAKRLPRAPRPRYRLGACWRCSGQGCGSCDEGAVDVRDDEEGDHHGE